MLEYSQVPLEGADDGHSMHMKATAHLWGPGNLGGARETQHEQVQHETVVLDNEGRELEAADEAIGVGVRHILVGNHHIVLGRHVVRDVVVQDQTQQPVQQRQVHLQCAHMRT